MNETEQNAGNIVIGNDVTLKGTIHVPNRAVINGAIDGEITARELVVGQTGRIIGHAKTERADIYGEVNQTLDVSQSLILRSTGKVVGVIQYTEIEIEKGGLVEGKLSQLQNAPVATPPAPAPVAISSPEPPKNSDHEEEL